MTTASRGFTLIEILVVIGMLGILATIVLVAVNPLRQFAQARNTEREAHVTALLNAIGERLADNRGVFEGDADCPTALPNTVKALGSSGYSIRPCIVPTYLSQLPIDPVKGNCSVKSCETGSYDTGYTIEVDADTARVTICAPGHAESSLPGTEAFCLSR